MPSCHPIVCFPAFPQSLASQDCDITSTTMFKPNPVEELLGGMSPMQARSSNSDHGSVSLVGKPSSSEMSIDSMDTSTTRRAPLGELQNTFEFKPQHQMQKPAEKGFNFTAGMKRPMANSMLSVGQVQHSPAPATPASITSKSTHEPAGPPLITLASLSKMTASADSDTVTPMNNMHTAHVPLSRYSGSPDMAAKKSSKIVWQDVLMWKQPLQTATLFTAGLAAFWFLNFAAYGAHNMTLMSALSYLLLLDLSFNFFRYFVSKSWHEQCLWGGAAQMKHFLTSLNAQVLRLAAAHDRYLSAVDPFITLKVAFGLWATAWVGSFLSLWWAVLLAYLGAFTIPVTYHSCKPHLQSLGLKVKKHTIDRIDAFGLPRTVRFLACVAGVVVLWLTTSFTQCAIGFVVACTYWRTLLAPREIDAFRTVAEPYTVSAFKVGRRISTAASDVFDRMSTAGPKTRTKSHFGKHRVE